MKWISSAELARLAGVSREAIRKAIEQNRITAVQRNGRRVMVEAERALAQFRGEREPEAPAPDGEVFYAWGSAPEDAAPLQEPEPEPLVNYTGLEILDGAHIDEHWNMLADQVYDRLYHDGWRLPPLTGSELCHIWRCVEWAAEGSRWDTESVAFWQMMMDDGGPDPWRCGHCGKPWHPSHPQYEDPPA
jgi:hypothetical protein